MKSLIEIDVTPDYWDKAPSIRVLLNNIELFNDTISTSQTVSIKYDNNTIKDSNVLEIYRYGKTIEDTQIDESGNILQDQVLHLNSISLNEIELGNIIYTVDFYPEYPEPWASEQKQQGIELVEKYSPCTSFFHNGVWRLEWTEPFHIWYLERLWT